MRTAAAATFFISGLLVLSACGTPPTPQNGAVIQGNVFASGAAGGAPIQGARVTAQFGDDTESVITGPDGHFRLALNTTQTAQAFTVTVEPPAGSNLIAATYDKVPLEAYRSPYGAANEMNIYLGTTRPSGPLPGAPARRGCVAGILKDLNGQPVPSNAREVIQTGPDTAIPRPLYDNCATEFSAIPFFSVGQSLTPPQPGETGLVVYGGGRVVRTDEQGRYVMPVQTTQNLFGVSGSMWAGNYDGTDTGNPRTASAYFWSKFQYIPEVQVFTSGATDRRDIQLEAFNPATNPRVTTQAIQYDGSALRQDGSDFLIQTVPSFEHAITSGALTLGEYYNDDLSGSDTMRVVKLASDTRAQNINVSSAAIRFDKDDNYTGQSVFIGWRDGTNLGQALRANFLGIPDPQTPAADAEGASRTPTLSWEAVEGAKTYAVSVYLLPEDEAPVPVWRGYTPGTSVQVPIKLEADAQYLWQVYTDDSTEMLDYIGRDPLRMEAELWKSPSRLSKVGGYDSALNRWRGEIARGIVQAGGQLGHRLAGTDAAYQNLLQTGYREAYSQEFTFTTGK